MLRRECSPLGRFGSQAQLHPGERFEEECDQGYWQRFEQYEPFAWDHRLVALKPEQPPSNPRATSPTSGPTPRSSAAAKKPSHTSRTTSRGVRCRSTIWYAAQALGDDPLPLLTAIALERVALSPETLDDLTEELSPPTSQPSPLTQYARVQGWKEFLTLVAQDPLGHRYIDDRHES